MRQSDRTGLMDTNADRIAKEKLDGTYVDQRKRALQFLEFDLIQRVQERYYEKQRQNSFRLAFLMFLV